MATDLAVTGTDTGVPAPSQTLPPTVPQETTSVPATAQVESTPLGNATGVSNPPDEQINVSQDEPPAPQMGGPSPLQPGAMPPKLPPQPPQNVAQAPKGVSPDNPNASHPAVQRAGLFHTIAEALAGGPRFQVKVNPLTGETERTRLPMSNGSILGAIALEALGGAAAGLGVAPGPGNLGRAAAAGYGQISQQQQEAKDRQNKEASDDFARHARIFETNLQMHNNAQQIGKQTLENNQAYVGQYQDLANKILNDYPNVAQNIVPESELSKYHATKDNAIPYKVVPRLDQDGHQSTDQYGSPQWDVDYIVVDPKFKADDLLTQQDRDDAAKYHLQGFVGADGKPTKLPSNLMLSLGMVTNYKAQIAALKLADQDLGDSYGLLQNNKPTSGTNYQFNSSGQVNVPNDSKQADQLDSAATKYNVPKAILRSVALQESGGHQLDPNTGKLVASGTGPTGIMQIAKSTAKTYGGDPSDQAQNIDMSAHYLSDLITKHGGDLAGALTEYGGGDKAVPGYASQVLQRAGVTSSVGSKGADTTTRPPDLNAALSQDPGLKDALKRFQPFRVNTKGSLQEAIQAFGKSNNGANSDAAAKITKLYGGDQNIQKIDQARELSLEAQKNALSEKKTQDNAAAKQLLDRQVSDEKEAFLHGPPKWRFDPAVANAQNPEEAAEYLQNKGVKVPERFDSLWKIAHNDVPLTEDAARTWDKGSPYSTDQAWATSYITKFINPNFKAGDYKIINDERDAMHSDKPNTPGGTLNAAGTATQHMNLLLGAAKNLPNLSLNDDTSLLALNKIATELGTATGKSAATVFEGIRNQLGTEVAKVVAGGVPTLEEQKRVQDAIAPYSSPAQIKDLMATFNHLMAGRLQTMEDNYYTKTGEHIVVDHNTTNLFQQYGIGTPWLSIPKGHNQPLANPQIANQYLLAAGKLPQGTYDPKNNPNGWNYNEARRLAGRDGWVFGQQQQPSNNQVAQGGQ